MFIKTGLDTLGRPIVLDHTPDADPLSLARALHMAEEIRVGTAAPRTKPPGKLIMFPSNRKFV
ncbi:MAG: hypothetical protein ACRD3Q_18250 [Terriglobales bacterium]